MTQIDNSKIFLEGCYTDVAVTVAAETTYKAGTVLGRNSDGDLVAYSTDLNVEADPEEEVEAFTSEPLYILVNELVNTDEDYEKTFDMVRVFDGGVVNKAKLVFVKTADASDVATLDFLKKNGIKLANVEELSEATRLR